MRNDYNVKFLPQTQFLDLNLEKKKIDFGKEFEIGHKNSKWTYKTFYLDVFDQKTIFVDYLGGIYFIENSKILNNKSSRLIPTKIESNINTSKVL